MATICINHSKTRPNHFPAKLDSFIEKKLLFITFLCTKWSRLMERSKTRQISLFFKWSGTRTPINSWNEPFKIRTSPSFWCLPYQTSTTQPTMSQLVYKELSSQLNYLTRKLCLNYFNDFWFRFRKLNVSQMTALLNHKLATKAWMPLA
jgi:hypothetical protein